MPPALQFDAKTVGNGKLAFEIKKPNSGFDFVGDANLRPEGVQLLPKGHGVIKKRLENKKFD